MALKNVHSLDQALNDANEYAHAKQRVDWMPWDTPDKHTAFHLNSYHIQFNLCSMVWKNGFSNKIKCFTCVNALVLTQCSTISKCLPTETASVWAFAWNWIKFKLIFTNGCYTKQIDRVEEANYRYGFAYESVVSFLSRILCHIRGTEIVDRKDYYASVCDSSSYGHLEMFRRTLHNSPICYDAIACVASIGPCWRIVCRISRKSDSFLWNGPIDVWPMYVHPYNAYHTYGMWLKSIPSNELLRYAVE